MCDVCAVPVQIPQEIIDATQAQATANALERLNRMKQENQTYQALTAVEKEHTNQAENLRNYEQSKTQSDREKYQIKQELNQENNKQLAQVLDFERAKNQILAQKNQVLIEGENQKLLQASQDLEADKMFSEFKS
ncbi:hypothetical protein [Floridanema evergladense]|uniref:Uncharacterized protein n=1 Tax=Floridaenema evergladense BLCC-F167 TaxID=3153639 RepID=A0ABV4WU15_9CYAN